MNRPYLLPTILFLFLIGIALAPTNREQQVLLPNTGGVLVNEGIRGTIVTNQNIPYSTTLLLTRPDGSQTPFTTAPDGTFMLTLPAGYYSISSPSNSSSPYFAPVSITVFQNSYTTVLIRVTQN